MNLRRKKTFDTFHDMSQTTFEDKRLNRSKIRGLKEQSDKNPTPFGSIKQMPGFKRKSKKCSETYSGEVISAMSGTNTKYSWPFWQKKVSQDSKSVISEVSTDSAFTNNAVHKSRMNARNTQFKNILGRRKPPTTISFVAMQHESSVPTDITISSKYTGMNR